MRINRPYIYTQELDEKTTCDLDAIVVQKTEDKEKGIIDSWMNKYSNSIDVRVSVNKSESTKKVIDIVTQHFENAGISVNTNDGYITYVSYEYNSSKYIPYDDWVENIYCANEAFVGKVYECIIVTKKDENLKGGNMEVYNKNPNTFFHLIGYEQEERDVYELTTGKVMTFNGETYHKLQTFAGNGSFNFIIVTLYDTNTDDGSEKWLNEMA